MSVRELLPYGAVIGAGGVALLLVVRPPALRLVGLVLLAVGLIPLVLHEQPSIGDRLQAHPVLAVPAAARRARRCSSSARAIAVRWPWLVVAGCLDRGPASAAARSTVARRITCCRCTRSSSCGLAAHAYEIVRGRARPPALGILGPALAAWVRARERVAVLDVEPRTRARSP